jgi:hypothetical protein
MVSEEKVSFEKALIWSENNGNVLYPMLFDDHLQHIAKHLPYLWRKGMIAHVFQHVRLYRAWRKNNLPKIQLEDIINRKR